MHPIAIKHARERLKDAVAAYGDLGRSNSFAETERAWFAFLSAAQAIYIKLERGARDDKQSAHWFGKVKGERRADPLLKYMHHARNTAEHGLREITERRSGHFALKGHVHIEHLTITNGKIDGVVRSMNPARPATAEFEGPSVQLIPVADERAGRTYAVPTEHLGIPLGSANIVDIAGLAVRYLERIVREATELSEQ